jgi:hypothetical protein
VTKGSVTGSRAGEGPLGADTAHLADQMAKGSEVYGVYLTKGPVTGRAEAGLLPDVDKEPGGSDGQEDVKCTVNT